ncbi:hypothetical protein J6P92_06065 [bacterium]|nr:hypothetical protein [bacterium]
MTTYPSIYANKYGDYYTLGAFAAGAGNAQDSDIGSQLAVGAILGGLPLVKGTVWDGPKWLYDNWGHYGKTWESMKDAHKAQKDIAKTFKKAVTVSDKWWGSAYNWTLRSARLQEYQGWQAKPIQARINCDKARYKELLKDNPAKARLYRMTYRKSNRLIDEAYKPVREILEKTKTLQGAELRTALKELEYAGYHAELKVLQGRKAETIKSVGKYAKAWNFVKQKSGYNKLNRGLLKGMTYGIDDTGKVIAGKGDKIGAKALRTVSKGAKGGGLLTAGIEMAFETPEIIETYSKLGAAKGTKQLGKSAATATASAVGWVVGAKVGGIAGAKIGGIIGSFFGPGPGTAIGAAIGGIIGVGCGILGSWLCHKGMKSLMGKSELEKAKDEQALALAKKASESDEGKQELLEATKAQADAQGGVSDQKIIDTYTKLLNERQTSLTQAQTSDLTAQTSDSIQVDDKKSALLQQLENFNVYTSQYQASNPFNNQSIFS